MIKEILFASQNNHKVEEISLLLPDGYSLLGLRDINWTMEIPEPFETYEENAKAKAYFVFDRTGLNCFADDSGLEIDALDGRPGVFSARYGGLERDSNINMQKVLSELENEPNRSARFHSVIAYIDEEKEMHVFEGKVEGTIAPAPAGHGGFGYDPIFIPLGFDQTFGQLPESLKNKISHRALAMEKFISFLEMNKSV
ncbi:MAG: RdgB/HAM1 family non-canonical purine NTP pyrophosphatase [Saprospiraceae bacterium]|uniref:dITP/XTP pyrophosphatase n=1 Tax=Candidatus Opimibacter skivensis TaxID=2982028 RepID=A0A9D7ST76_9BACT|nr:RdgB/HAM1 family non-canonical purine NTP pyrophosphatase [Candidatus Opimibacter skivensis]